MFIRYNPGIKLWEYDTSPNQTGIGPWVKLPIDPSQLVSGGGGSNIAFTDAANIFTPNQQFLGGYYTNFHGWKQPNAGVDLKIWHEYIDNNGVITLYPVNDANNTVLSNGIRVYRNSDMELFGRLITNEGRVLVKQGSSLYGIEIQAPTHTVLLFNELNQGVDNKKWRWLVYNAEFRFEALNDAENGIPFRIFTAPRDGSFNIHGLLFTDTYMGSMGVYYPGRVDVATRQYAWYLGSHPAYGLYSNTGLALSAALTAPQVSFPSAQSASSSANVLDDYEEGTWLPRIWGVDGEVTSYSTQTGTYTKVGNLVTCAFDAVIQAANWSGGQPVYVYMPWNPIGSGGCSMSYWGLSGSFIWLTTQIEPGNARAHFPYKASTVSGGIDSYLLTGNVGPGSRLSGTMTFSVTT